MKRYFEKFVRERRSLTRLYKTHYAIHGRITRFSHSTSVVRLRCCVESGWGNSASRLHSFPGKSAKYRRVSAIPLTATLKPLEPPSLARQGRGEASTRRTGDEMEWWRVTDPLSSTHTYRQPRHPYNRPFLIEFQTISLSLSFNEEVAS